MKYIKQLLFFLFLFGGITLCAIPSMRNSGVLVLFGLFPFFLVFMLLELKGEIKRMMPTFRAVLLPFVLLNTSLILLAAIFKIMHYPGLGLIKFAGGVSTFITLVIGIVYVVVNRKQLTNAFTYELMLLLFPALFFIWSIVPFNNPPQLKERYTHLLTASTRSLEYGTQKVVSKYGFNQELQQLEKIKDAIISKTGGLTIEDETMVGFYSEEGKVVILQNKDFLDALDVSPKLKKQLFSAHLSGEMVYLITLMEQELALNECVEE